MDSMKSIAKKEDSPIESISDDSPPQRPKRNTCQKNLGVSNGLLWREETDLKKALYASLQETRRRNWDDEEVNTEEEIKIEDTDISQHENGQEDSPKKAKVHAQRKFAQGSTPNSPIPIPLKIPYSHNSRTELLPCRRPKTEDFLTFLCLRGTTILPPSLDFLNTCPKSDTSSEGRCSSPEVELREFPIIKESNSLKSNESKEKHIFKCENNENGIIRKHACKASSKRQIDIPYVMSKRMNSHPPKFFKEESIMHKRKSRNNYDEESIEFIPKITSQSRSKICNNKTRTTMHALREKYKKQRLATNKKKLMPPKALKSSNSSKENIVNNIQAVKKPDNNSSERIVTRNQIKTIEPILSKARSFSERKLALEKRRSLRSANSLNVQKRLSLLSKKTPWLRRAKLVPPIVDIDSDSELEVLSFHPKKSLSPKPNCKIETLIKESNEHLTDRLRKRHSLSKSQSHLTARQISLRKHMMQNRSIQRKSVLNTKNIRSRRIIKKKFKQDTNLKANKKNLVNMKTMSLRKDLQNKRITRSAKHKIEEMFWSNPEKRGKTRSIKRNISSKLNKRQISNKHPSKGKVMQPNKEKVVQPNKEKVLQTLCKIETKDKKLSEPISSHIENDEIKGNENNKSFGSNNLNDTTKSNNAFKFKEPKKIACNLQKGISYIDEKPSSQIESTIIASHSESNNLSKETPKNILPNDQTLIKKESRLSDNHDNSDTSHVMQSLSHTPKQLEKNNLSISNITKESNLCNHELKLCNHEANEKVKLEILSNNTNYLENQILDKVENKELNSLKIEKIIENNLNLVEPQKNKEKDISQLTSSEEINSYRNLEIDLNIATTSKELNIDQNIISHEPSKINLPEELILKNKTQVEIKNTDKKSSKKSLLKDGNKIHKKYSDKGCKSHRKDNVKVSKKNLEKILQKSSKEAIDYDNITLDKLLKLNFVDDNILPSSDSESLLDNEQKELNISMPSTSSFHVQNDFKAIKKDHDKELSKIKKDGESSKHKKDSKNKINEKDLLRALKKEDKFSKKDSEKSLAKLLKKELSKSNKKEEKSKHKRDSSSGIKSSKKDDKDGIKISKKDSELDAANFGLQPVVHTEITDVKKEKSNKKLSRSSSLDESKSPSKKKKKHNEFKDIEKIKNLISKSSIFTELSSLKEFKRRSSGDKSDLKKHSSKSKKRKKLALLKEKKLSKKLSSKLLRKYSKKKGVKSKKKLKKKELLKELKLTNQGEKLHSKSKKQKHKAKGEHHKNEALEKSKINETVSSDSENMVTKAQISKPNIDITSETETGEIIAPESNNNNNSNTIIATTNIPSFVFDSISENVPTIESITTESSQTVPTDLVFGPNEEIHNLMGNDFTGVFDEAFPGGAILLTTRDSLSQVPLHFLQDLSITKTVADAATNTGEDDLVDVSNNLVEQLRNEEMSVGTQTMTPVGSPLPSFEIKASKSPSPLVVEASLPSFSDEKSSHVQITLPVPQETPTNSTSNLTSTKSNPPRLAASLASKSKKRTVSSFKKCKPSQNESLTKLEPFPNKSAKMVDAPVYRPSLEEFRDPLEYICKIQAEAGQYGICKIIPPSSFKPECKVNDDMRFTAHNQYIHKMLYRWGPNVQHVACIKKHLKSQKVKFEHAPLIGGIELDISKFYHTVQQFGGLQQVIEKKKWQKVADVMRIPKTAQDRVTKLYDAYCKYLVSYDTLPREEKQKLEEEVILEHENRVKSRFNSRDLEKEPDKDEDETEEEDNNDCVTKGRSMSLSNFFRIARNTMSMRYKTDPSPEEVEHEFWKLVTERQNHIVVHAGNIDSSVYQSGFACNRNSPFAKHPWNLKILTNNSNSILRCMGPVSGITIPTLHVGMLFTAGCWYRDPHSLPWIEYLHTGASKIWYSIPPNGSEKFREAMKKIMPECNTKNPIWLASDTAMVPPDLLVKHGASLSRTVQHSGQFIVIFPESFTSTICCGYCVSESVYFAPTSWLDLALKAFKDIRDSCEPPAFSLERLLFCIANDPKAQLETLQKILPFIKDIRSEELRLRSRLSELGLKNMQRLPLLETKDKKKKLRGIEEENEQECEICRTHCYVSMVINPQDDLIYCLPHALEHIEKENLKSYKLPYTYNEN